MSKDKPERCDECGTTEWKAITRFSWNNNVLVNTRDYCQKCRRKYAPPAGQVKGAGGTVLTIKKKEQDNEN